MSRYNYNIVVFVLFCFLFCLLFAVPVAIAQDSPRPGTAPFVSKGEVLIEEKFVSEANIFESMTIPFESMTIPTLAKQIITTEEIDLGGPGCYDGYRWYNQDVNTYFFDQYYPGCTLRSATLTIKNCDCDFYDQPASNAELDVVQFGPKSIDILKGWNGQWNTMSWDVRRQVLNNTSTTIPFAINVDAAHNYYYWAVTIDWARLVTVWTCP